LSYDAVKRERNASARVQRPSGNISARHSRREHKLPWIDERILGLTNSRCCEIPASPSMTASAPYTGRTQHHSHTELNRPAGRSHFASPQPQVQTTSLAFGASLLLLSDIHEGPSSFDFALSKPSCCSCSVDWACMSGEIGDRSPSPCENLAVRFSGHRPSSLSG